jgi:hypothetical protein
MAGGHQDSDARSICVDLNGRRQLACLACNHGAHRTANLSHGRVYCRAGVEVAPKLAESHCKTQHSVVLRCTASRSIQALRSQTVKWSAGSRPAPDPQKIAEGTPDESGHASQKRCHGIVHVEEDSAAIQHKPTYGE